MSELFRIDKEGDIIPLEPTNTFVVTHKDIELIRKNVTRHKVPRPKGAQGPMKFAHIKNRAQKLSIAAATIESVEDDLAHANDTIAAMEEAHAREIKDLIHENRKLIKRVDHFKDRAEKHEKMYERSQWALDNAVTNYCILRETYDCLRKKHPLPAERTFPRRPKRSREDADLPAVKKSK